MEITINIKDVAVNEINKYSLFQSKTDEIINIYKAVFEKTEGSLTTVSDNDAISKINVAINKLQPSEEQLTCLNNFRDAFKYVENCIDPSRLNFTITKTVENEICINHFSNYGVSKIIIDEDGLIAHSFISLKGINKQDFFNFHEGVIDYQTLTFNLFV